METPINLNLLSDIFTVGNLQLFLLAGSGILAVALLLLALTHWGHSRPIWKCVILSFVAHILLMGYLYGTRLIWNTPPAIAETASENHEELRVSVVDDEGQQETSTTLVDQISSETVAGPEMELPTIAPLVRPEIDSELVIKKVEAPVYQDPDPAPAPPEMSVDATPDKSFPLQLERSPEQDLALLPEAKIIEPEPLTVPKESSGGLALDGPEVLFNADLPRPELPTQETSSTLHNSARPTPPKEAPQLRSAALAASDLPTPERAPSLLGEPSIRRLPPSIDASEPSLKVVQRSRRLGDGQPLPQLYSLRSVSQRESVARSRGGSIETEAAVEAALRWLAQNQQADGRWDPRGTGAGREDRVFGHNREGAGAQADTGITALATLAFLAAGHTHLEGEYQTVVDKALRYLQSEQQSNGDLSGQARLFAKMYCHSMSLLALSEALAMTGDQRLRHTVQRGVNFSEYAQNPGDGGWRYQPGDSGDMSQFGWHVLALHSAKLGGIQVKQQTFQGMRSFLAACSSGPGDGLAAYRPGQGPSTTMTAEALLCRFVLEDRVSPLTILEAQRKISRERPNTSHINLYYWYYGTLAMYHAGGDRWQEWNESMKSTLLELQIRDGESQGSWEPNGMWGGYGGRVYSTAMATLNLEVYYRYLSLYQELADSSSNIGGMTR